MATGRMASLASCGALAVWLLAGCGGGVAQAPKPAVAPVVKPAEITDIQVSGTGDAVQLTVTANAKVAYSLVRQTTPPRLFLQLTGHHAPRAGPGDPGEPGRGEGNQVGSLGVQQHHRSLSVGRSPLRHRGAGLERCPERDTQACRGSGRAPGSRHRETRGCAAGTGSASRRCAQRAGRTRGHDRSPSKNPRWLLPWTTGAAWCRSRPAGAHGDRREKAGRRPGRDAAGERTAQERLLPRRGQKPRHRHRRGGQQSLADEPESRRPLGHPDPHRRARAAEKIRPGGVRSEEARRAPRRERREPDRGLFRRSGAGADRGGPGRGAQRLR